MAALASYRVAAVGVRGWAPKTQTMSTLAGFEGSRALQSSLTYTLSEFSALRVSMGQARSTIRRYVSTVRAAEDVRLLPGMSAGHPLEACEVGYTHARVAVHGTVRAPSPLVQSVVAQRTNCGSPCLPQLVAFPEGLCGGVHHTSRPGNRLRGPVRHNQSRRSSRGAEAALWVGTVSDLFPQGLCPSQLHP